MSEICPKNSVHHKLLEYFIYNTIEMYMQETSASLGSVSDADKGC